MGKSIHYQRKWKMHNFPNQLMKQIGKVSMMIIYHRTHQLEADYDRQSHSRIIQIFNNLKGFHWLNERTRRNILQCHKFIRINYWFQLIIINEVWLIFLIHNQKYLIKQLINEWEINGKFIFLQLFPNKVMKNPWKKLFKQQFEGNNYKIGFDWKINS